MDRKENPFDQFDSTSTNPFDQFDEATAAQAASPFDRFDEPAKKAEPGLFERAKTAVTDLFTPQPSKAVKQPSIPEVAPTQEYREPAMPAPPPLAPEVAAQLNRKYDALPQADRDKIIRQRTKDGRQSLESMYFAYRDRQFQMQDAATAEAAQRIGPMVYRISDLADPRREARSRMALGQGASNKTAENIASQAAQFGTPTEEVIPQAKPSQFDFDLAAQYKNMNPVVRGAVKGFYGYKQSVLGLNQALGDLVGAEDFAATQRAGGDRAAGAVEAIGERPDYMGRNFENAVTSIAQNIPTLLAGVVTGGTVVPMSVLWTQTYGQEYGNGKRAGLNGEQAAQRAGLFATAEIVGESLGLRNLTNGLRKAIGKKSFDKATNAVYEYILNQIPGEQLTTALQFLGDKYPDFALNPKATFKDYLSQASDTLTQTVMQGGIMLGGVKGAQVLAGRRGPAEPAPVAPAIGVPPVTSPEGVRAEPTVAAEPELAPTARVEPTIEPEAAAEAPVELIPGMVRPEMVTEEPEAPLPVAAEVVAAEPVEEATAPPAIKPAVTPPQEPSLETAVGGMQVVEVPLKDLTLSKDVPQFKMGADDKGVVEPLGGKFERTGVAPIQVWRRNDGRLEVISGRHRLDLARRSGEKSIPAQVHDESQGFTPAMAAVLDAELNIRDGQGKVKDYVNYFKASGITQEAADARGLLARATGKRAFTVSSIGSDELVAAIRNDQVPDEAAYYIALNAPNDSRLQGVGIQAVMDGKSANMAVNMMQAIKALGVETDTTTDMFGFDDSAMKEAQAMAQIANRKQREIQTRLSAISGAAKNPALAKAEGIDIRDPEAVNRRIGELRQMKVAWDNWSTNPELIGQIRAERGVGAPSLALRGETEAEIRAREEAAAAEERRQRAEEDAARRAEQEAAERARAEETVGLFELGQTPDQQLSGMGDLFAPPSQEPAQTAAAPTVEQVINAINQGRELGRGGNAVVFDMPGTPYVVRVPYKTATPSPQDTVVPVANLFPGKNFGQPLFAVGDVKVLRKQEGIPAGLAYPAYRDLSQEQADSQYAEATKAAAEMPQSAYDKFAEDLKYLNEQGAAFDPSKSNNVLIDKKNGAFNLVDINQQKPERYNNSFGDMVVTLIGNTYAWQYKGAEDLTKARATIYKKAMAAAKKAGLSINEDDSSTRYSKQLASQEPAIAKTTEKPFSVGERVIYNKPASRVFPDDQPARIGATVDFVYSNNRVAILRDDTGQVDVVDVADLDSEGPLAFNIEPAEPAAAKPSRSRLGLYSALLEGINSVPTTSAPAASWKSVIKGLVNKGQAKAEEVEWSGINDWLDLQQGRVTKDQVTQYLRDGGVQVEETVLGSVDSSDLDAYEQPDNSWNIKRISDGLFLTNVRGFPNDPEGAIAEAALRIRGDGITKYGSYTLPGGANYREVLLTLPSREPKTYTYEVLGAFPQDGFATREEAQDYIDKFTKRLAKAEAEGQDFSYMRESIERSPFFIQEYESAESIKKSYRSPHFEQPNILASIRVNDRTDADGNKVLFVEEIQSDWAQKGRKEGFGKKQLGGEVFVENEGTDEEEWLVRFDNGEVEGGFEYRQAAEHALRNRVPVVVLAAPFVTKTEGWLNLALKRIMVMAAEGGYDKVAFINGEQSAERYDLSKEIDEIYYRRNDDGTFDVAANDTRRDETRWSDGAATKKTLEDTLGKEIASKIVEGGKEGFLRGVDLKVGGEGMKAFYDQIVPLAVKKLLPKVGGGQMEAVRLPGIRKTAVPMNALQPGFTVTSEMRDKVAEGVPLFSIEPGQAPITVEFVTPSQQIREEQISELQSLRQRLAAIPRKVAEERLGPLEPMLVKSMLARAADLKQALLLSKERRDSPEQFLARALKEYDDGNLSEEVLNVIKAAYAKNPALLNGLLLSVKQAPKGMGRAAGSFASLSRIVSLYKGTSGVQNASTIRHELAHSLEQMMTPEQRVVVVEQWRKALDKAIKDNPDEKHQKYFEAVLNFLNNPNTANYQKAISLLPSYDMYQYISPSEYWAVNAEPLMAAQLGGHWQRFKAAMRRLFEGLKKVLGFNNQYAVHKTFRDIMNGSKERITKEMLADYVMDVAGPTEYQNIEEDKKLLERYNRPKTPMLNTRPISNFFINQWQGSKQLFTDMVKDPKKAIARAGQAYADELPKEVEDQSTIDDLLRLRNKAVWYGAGLESRDREAYGGALRVSEKIVVASVALDNAIRSGNIGVQVVFMGGLQLNSKFGQFVAVETPLSMRGVYEAEKRLKEKLGDQLGTDIVQAYFEAKRSISINNEFLNRLAAREGAKANLEQLERRGASKQDIKDAKALLKDAEDSLEAVKKAVSSVTMSEDEMYEFADLDERHPELREMMTNWTSVNRNLLQVWRQVGLLSQERFNTLYKMADYSPWNRIMLDDEDPHSPLHSTTRTLTNIGREKRFKRGTPTTVIDITAKEGQRSFKIPPSTVVGVEVNGDKVDQDLLSVSPEGEVVLDYPVEAGDLVVFKTVSPIQNIVENMTQNVMRMTMNALRQYAQQRIIVEYATRDKDGQIMTFPSMAGSKNRFYAIIDGVRKIVEIPDDVVMDAIYGMESMNLEMLALPAAVSNFFRRTITLSGVFQVKQVFKDAPTAAMVTGVRRPFVLIGGVYKGLLTALLQPGLKKLGYNIEPVVDILRAAGTGGFYTGSRTPEAEVKQRLGIMNNNVFDFVIRALDHIGDSADIAQRIAVYKRVLAETGDEAQALYQAVNVINFQHHGASATAQVVVKTVPFSGAYANATDVLINALLGGGLKGMSRAKAIQRLAITTTLLMFTTLLYRMAVGDDPEYEELDDQTKLRNYIIPGTDIMLPMNTSAGFIFKALPEMIYNKVITEGTKNEIDRTRLKAALAQAARDMMLGPEPIPQIVKTPLEIALDYSFFTGRSVVPENLKDVEAAEQYNAATSELGKYISAATEIFGTDGKRLLSPIAADHLVRGMFGTAGSMAQWFTNSIAAASGERIAPPERQTPITGSFKRPAVPRGNEDLFYDLKERSDKKYETWNQYIARGQTKEAAAYMKQHSRLIAMHDYTAETAESLSEINQLIRYYGEYTKSKLSPEERRKKVEQMQRTKQRILSGVKAQRRAAGL